MAKVLVFQHVAAEPLGMLDPMIRQRGHRIRYVNFSRDPNAQPTVDRYHALIVLGGPMVPDDTAGHPHLATEIRCIERALERDIPVLGICLGAQLLAHTLGAAVRPGSEWEIGWYPVGPGRDGGADRLFAALTQPTPIFQWHGYTFDLPAGAKHLARSAAYRNQAFRYADCAYGLQFHLELDRRLINRWLSLPAYLEELENSGVVSSAEQIRQDTDRHIANSNRLGQNIFGGFLDLLGQPAARAVLPSR